MNIGAIEAGGTKVVCGIGTEEGTMIDYISFPTAHPKETLNQAIEYFRNKDVQAMGIGSFGPIGVTLKHPDYGRITTTPKPGWSGFDFLGTLKKAINVPYGWDTDVNAAAFGESRWGVAKNLDNCVYYTIGTGIGAGIYSEGRLVHGLIHPEGGHVFTRKHPSDPYQGSCPFHGDCLEGLASGKAIENRWNSKGIGLPKDHEAWKLEAFYLSQAITNTILLLSPKMIILGGGVMQQEQLFPMIRKEVTKNLNGYVDSPTLVSGIDRYIVPPGLGNLSGLYGALALGIEALQNGSN